MASVPMGAPVICSGAVAVVVAAVGTYRCIGAVAVAVAVEMAGAVAVAVMVVAVVILAVVAVILAVVAVTVVVVVILAVVAVTVAVVVLLAVVAVTVAVVVILAMVAVTVEILDSTGSAVGMRARGVQSLCTSSVLQPWDWQRLTLLEPAYGKGSGGGKNGGGVVADEFTGRLEMVVQYGCFIGIISETAMWYSRVIGVVSGTAMRMA
ncbi:hypothetical protein BU17DRAFT_71940 [Hysterangium stoloniferum]|nr:hypothetical protein BU17DRAFT_71940 [Hysterangium stoloniferum]